MTISIDNRHGFFNINILIYWVSRPTLHDNELTASCDPHGHPAPLFKQRIFGSQPAHTPIKEISGSRDISTIIIPTGCACTNSITIYSITMNMMKDQYCLRTEQLNFVWHPGNHDMSHQKTALPLRRKLSCVNIVIFWFKIHWNKFPKAVSAKFASPWPQTGGGLAYEAFAGPVRLAIMCENYIGSYCWDMQLTCRTCNINIFVGPWACMAFKVFTDTAKVHLTLKHRETHGCVVSTVATDALVLKHQAISILSTD